MCFLPRRVLVVALTVRRARVRWPRRHRLRAWTSTRGLHQLTSPIDRNVTRWRPGHSAARDHELSATPKCSVGSSWWWQGAESAVVGLLTAVSRVHGLIVLMCFLPRRVLVVALTVRRARVRWPRRHRLRAWTSTRGLHQLTSPIDRNVTRWRPGHSAARDHELSATPAWAPAAATSSFSSSRLLLPMQGVVRRSSTPGDPASIPKKRNEPINSCLSVHHSVLVSGLSIGVLKHLRDDQPGAVGLTLEYPYGVVVAVHGAPADDALALDDQVC